jgi:hypothetical protein
MKQFKTQYKVTYSRMEGDNYAGGWVERTMTVDTLAQAGEVPNIKEIQRIEVYIYPDPVPISDALEAARLARLKKADERKAAEIAALKQRIQELEEK